MMAFVIALTPAVQRFDWGAPDGLPQLLGIAADGGPYAEAWWGAHPLVPSDTDQGTLDAVIGRDPEGTLGPDVAREFGRLPYLLKVLSIARPLSIQVHPTAQVAQEGFAAEQACGPASGDGSRTFTDAFHKPELLLAMTHMEVLAGFRPVVDLDRDLASLVSPGAAALREALAAGGLAAYVAAALDDGHLDAVAELASPSPSPDASSASSASGSVGAARRAAQLHPRDLGVLVALAMNHISLAPGESVFTPAGIVHCYLGGMGLEIMANSDNVVRAGLTSKPINTGLLRQIALLEHTPPTRPDIVDDGAVRTFRTEAHEFLLDVVEGGVASAPPGPRIVLAIGSDCDITTDAERSTVPQGHAVFVPASAGLATVTSQGMTAIASVPTTRR